MRPDLAFTIYRKEIRETLRDRRTLLMMVGLPILLYPLMIVLLGKVGESKQQERAERTSQVAVWGELPEALSAALGEEKVEIKPGLGLPDDLARRLSEGRVAPPQVTPAKGRAAEREPENPVLGAARAVVASRKAQAVVVAWPGAAQALAGDGLARLTVYYDSVNEDSRGGSLGPSTGRGSGF